MQILKVYKEAYFSKKRYLILRGGSSSGKSYFAAQKILSRILSEEGHCFLILRKIASTSKNSTFKLFKSIIAEENLNDIFTINKSDQTITCTLNDNQLLFSGLDDSEKIKSIAGITGCFLEEATEFTYEDWGQIQLRIRGQHKNYVQFIIAFNPVSSTHWLKDKLWDLEDDDIFKLVTTYRDNPLLSPEDIKHYEERVRKNSSAWLVYGLGAWGEIQTGGEIVSKFNAQYHVKPLNYNPELPLHISVDFNVLPTCTMAIYQFKDNIINLIDMVTLEHPHNLTKDMCREFAYRYDKHNAGLFVYGDVAGFSNDTRTEVGVNDYSIIMAMLHKFKPQLRIGRKAPSIVQSTNFLNAILEEDDSIGFKLFISDSDKCTPMVKDLLYLKQNSEGGKLIEYEKHPVTGTRYEKYSHSFDVMRYFLVQCFTKEYQTYMTGAKPFSTAKIIARPINKNSY